MPRSSSCTASLAVVWLDAYHPHSVRVCDLVFVRLDLVTREQKSGALSRALPPPHASTHVPRGVPLAVGAGFVVHKLATALFAESEPTKKSTPRAREDPSPRVRVHEDVEEHTRSRTDSPSTTHKIAGHHDAADVDSEVGVVVPRIQHMISHEELTKAGFTTPPVSPGRPGRTSTGEPPLHSPVLLAFVLDTHSLPLTQSFLSLLSAVIRFRMHRKGACILLVE